MAAVYPAGPEPTITTLACVDFVMVLHAPLAGAFERCLPAAAGQGRLFFTVQDVWLRAELCKIRNPSHPQSGRFRQSRSNERAILFREIIFRGMNGFMADPAISVECLFARPP